MIVFLLERFVLDNNDYSKNYTKLALKIIYAVAIHYFKDGSHVNKKLQNLAPYGGWFLSTGHKPRCIWEEEIVIEKMSLSDCPVGKSVSHFLINVATAALIKPVN